MAATSHAAPLRVVLATQNQHKIEELRALLRDDAPDVAARLHIVSLAELGVHDEPAEDGATFADNALIKARAAHAHTGLWSLADDSGLAVDALGGAPGVHSARYGGEPRSDARNIDALLAALSHVPASARQARFVCTLCLYGGSAVEPTTRLRRGECTGTLRFSPVGHNGFGYDPLFVPDPRELAAGGLADLPPTRTYAELSAAEKNRISHRTRALHAMLPILRALADGAPLPE
jgi:XTP/dITP diphosphohydrolase